MRWEGGEEDEGGDSGDGGRDDAAAREQHVPREGDGEWHEHVRRSQRSGGVRRVVKEGERRDERADGDDGLQMGGGRRESGQQMRGRAVVGALHMRGRAVVGA